MGPTTDSTASGHLRGLLVEKRSPRNPATGRNITAVRQVLYKEYSYLLKSYEKLSLTCEVHPELRASHYLLIQKLLLVGPTWTSHRWKLHDKRSTACSTTCNGPHKGPPKCTLSMILYWRYSRNTSLVDNLAASHPHWKDAEKRDKQTSRKNKTTGENYQTW